jgi:hypothetical protein
MDFWQHWLTMNRAASGFTAMKKTRTEKVSYLNAAKVVNIIHMN